jgi:lysophospholipase L1-like esterase
MKQLFLLNIIAFCGLIATTNATEWQWAKYDLPQSTVKTCIPLERGKWWPNHFKNMMKREPRETKLVFLGDSITMMWAKHGKYENGTEIWDKYYQPYNAANFGISGDKTETILWRLTAGENLKGMSPKVIVLLIGVNNLIQKDSAEDTAAGIKTIVKYLRKITPDTKIMLLGIFPAWSAKHPIRAKIIAVNKSIKSLNDGKNVFFLDIGHVFLEKDGSISKKVLRDTLHPGVEGFRRWAKAIQPLLKKLLQ